MKKRLFLLLAALFLLSACGAPAQESGTWRFGFAMREIMPDPDSDQPLYIAGYQNGAQITGVLDYCQARAVWLDAGAQGVLLIEIDCVALDSGTVRVIRDRLSDLPDCAAVNVCATHTHAGVDTLGLWGPIGADGKNDAYMQALIDAAAEAGREAWENRTEGAMYLGQTETEDMFRDSRLPVVYDPHLYQLRLAAHDGGPGVRLLFYGAHAESLRGQNTLLSRDFPGLLCDQVSEATGDHAMFLPGAIGGLIMTKAFVGNTDVQAEENLHITADKLTDYVLSIPAQSERAIPASLAMHRQIFTVPLENTAFLMYKALGILGNTAVESDSSTGYDVETELSVLKLGDLLVTLIPGEIFPELVLGGAYGDANPGAVNPRPLAEIAAQYGEEQLLIVGLANDEIGYIVPPSDFLLSERAPYLEKTMDHKGENHYEETNSAGPACADAIASAFEAALLALQTP